MHTLIIYHCGQRLKTIVGNPQVAVDVGHKVRVDERNYKVVSVRWDFDTNILDIDTVHYHY